MIGADAPETRTESDPEAREYWLAFVHGEFDDIGAEIQEGGRLSADHHRRVTWLLNLLQEAAP